MVQVRIEVEHGSLIKRWVSDAVAPDMLSLDLTGEAVTLESRETRSRPNITTRGSDLHGKLCVCESINEKHADEALMFAKNSGARALFVLHKPRFVATTIPTILMPPDMCEFIKRLPSSPSITVVPLKGSYKVLDVSLKAEHVTSGSDPVEWASKMYIPVTMLEETTSNLDYGLMVDATPFIFRDRDHMIDSIDSGSNEDRFSGKICLFHLSRQGDANRAVELATSHGARALIICGNDNPVWSEITLPVLANINEELATRLKRAGLKSHEADLGVAISYNGSKGDPVPEAREHVMVESIASLTTDPPDIPHQSHHLRQETKPDPPASKGKGGSWWNPLDAVGQVAAQAGSAVVEMGKGIKNALVPYSPKSNGEFNEIIREGTSWSLEGSSSSLYLRALKILDNVENEVDSMDKKKQEVEALVQAVVEMAAKNLDGDVLLLLFLFRLGSLRRKLNMSASNELTEAKCKVVENVVIHHCELELSSKDRCDIDDSILDLTKHLSNKSTNISHHARFVINAIWIRYVCVTIQDKNWNLRQVTSLKHIDNVREVMLSFMEPVHYNTLLVTSIARNSDLEDLCSIFQGTEAIPIQPRAMHRLQVIYEQSNSTTRAWQSQFGEMREITMLNLIGRLTVRQSDKLGLIKSVIKRASFESVGSFNDFNTIFSSLSSNHADYDEVARQIKIVICRSLSIKGKQRPTPRDVSSILTGYVGLTLVNETGWEALMTFLGNITEQNYNKTTELIELLGHIYDLFLRDPQWSEDPRNCADELANAIREVVKHAPKHNNFAIAAFQVANNRRNIFVGPDKKFCSQISSIIIDRTGFASTIRHSPRQLDGIPSLQLKPGTEVSFIGCLSHELQTKLTSECSKIENAVSFCMRAKLVHSPLAANIASGILFNSFSKWSPSNLELLLAEDASTLSLAYKFLNDCSPENSATRNGLMDGKRQAQTMRSIVTKWITLYKRDGYDAAYLDKLLKLWTNEKQEALAEISGQGIPTKSDLEEKLLEIKGVIQSIRSKIIFHHEKDNSSVKVSIRDLAAGYHLNTASHPIVSTLSEFFW